MVNTPDSVPVTQTRPRAGAARVLSDISAHVTFDLARNQLARTIDVMLQASPALCAPLSLRKPERTFLVLLTPALTQPGPAGDAAAARLGWASWEDCNTVAPGACSWLTADSGSR